MMVAKIVSVFVSRARQLKRKFFGSSGSSEVFCAISSLCFH